MSKDLKFNRKSGTGGLRWDSTDDRRFVWSPLGIDQYEWMTAPYVIITDPAYFYSAPNRKDRLIQGPMSRQLEIVSSRAGHIRPRIPGHRFLFEFDAHWRLRSITTGKNHAVSAKRAGLVKRKHLSLAIARQLSQRGDANGIAVLEEFLVDQYFGGAAELEPRRTELFFENDNNFDLECRKEHGIGQLKSCIPGISVF